MRRCNAKPYEGNEPFIFVSYSHTDRGMVYPVIEYLASKGYRIWYDDGIHPGSDWLEVIGQHVSSCDAFIAFISPRALTSHNCKNEFNFATMEGKKALTVILEPVQLSMALKMQMSTIQGIVRYDYPDFEQYINKFIQSDILSSCIGQPDDTIVVSSETGYEDAEGKNEENKTFDWFRNDRSKVVESEIKDEASGTFVPPEISEDEGVTVMMDEDDEKTVMFVMRYILSLRGTDEKIEITHSDFTIGRQSAKGQSDYMVDDDLKRVSRNHMTFIIDNETCILRDNGSINGTKLNGEPVKKGVDYPIHDGDVIVMGYEKYTFDVSAVMKKSE